MIKQINSNTWKIKLNGVFKIRHSLKEAEETLEKIKSGEYKPNISYKSIGHICEGL